MTTTYDANVDRRRRLTLNRLTAALLATPGDAPNQCWEQVRRMPEPDLPAVEWAQILTAAHRHATTLSVRSLPVASFDSAAVAFDEQRFIVAAKFVNSWQLKEPENARPSPGAIRHHNLASVIDYALQHPAAWTRIPTHDPINHHDAGDTP